MLPTLRSSRDRLLPLKRLQKVILAGRLSESFVNFDLFLPLSILSHGLRVSVHQLRLKMSKVNFCSSTLTATSFLMQRGSLTHRKPDRQKSAKLSLYIYLYPLHIYTSSYVLEAEQLNNQENDALRSKQLYI